VRELARACSLFLIHARPGERIDIALLERCLPEILQSEPNPRSSPLLWDGVSMKDAVRIFKRELILARLERHNGSVKAARESLGLTKTTFHRYVKGLGIATGGGTGEE
jgi:DNA-binding NtrC family response regulator